jgi:hypothetical protein
MFQIQYEDGHSRPLSDCRDFGMKFVYVERGVTREEFNVMHWKYGYALMQLTITWRWCEIFPVS